MDSFLYAWPTLILLAIGVRMALRLMYGARGPDEGDNIAGFLNMCSWVMLAMGLIPAILGAVVTFIGVLIVIMAAFTLVEIITQRRAAQRRSNAKLFSLYLSRKRQFDPSILFSTQALRGNVGRSAKAMFAALERGTPFLRAVREHPRALPPTAVAYLAAAGSSTSQANALRQLSQAEDSELNILWRSVVDRVSYISAVVFVMIAIMTFLMIKILPAYNDIFREFGLTLPPMTELAITSSKFFVNYLAGPVVLVIIFIAVAAAVIWCCYLCDFAVLRPIADRLFRGRRIAEVLRILAVAAEERAPIDQALNRVSLAYPSPTISRQLMRAIEAIGSGQPWQDSLFRARMISAPESALLKSAERTGALPWAFQQIARRRDKRSVYRLSSYVNVGYPFIILALGGVVAFYVISLFIPLVQLINGMSQ